MQNGGKLAELETQTAFLYMQNEANTRIGLPIGGRSYFLFPMHVFIHHVFTSGICDLNFECLYKVFEDFINFTKTTVDFKRVSYIAYYNFGTIKPQPRTGAVVVVIVW